MSDDVDVALTPTQEGVTLRIHVKSYPHTQKLIGRNWSINPTNSHII